MKKIIINHPTIVNSTDLTEICKPLKKLNITYFSHSHINNEGKFSALNNNAAFAKHYLENKYYHADIHLAKGEMLGKYIVWDSIEKTGRTDQMCREAIQLGIQHVFTIIEKSKNGCDFYHFGNNSTSNSINQIYLSNIDLLRLFITYFHESVAQSKSLLSAYNMTLGIEKNETQLGIKLNEDMIDLKIIRSDFIKSLRTHRINQAHSLNSFTNREIECLQLLVKGKTAKEIGAILGLTQRTVEFYIANIKSKLQVSSKSKLIEKVFDLFS